MWCSYETLYCPDVMPGIGWNGDRKPAFMKFAQRFTALPPR